MITEHGVLPEKMLDPKYRMRQGVILLGGSGFQPDSEEALIRLEGKFREMSLIIPDSQAMPTWLIDQEYGDGEESSLDPR
jgi:hypothetical protein